MWAPLRGASADGSAAAVSEARKRQQCTRPGQVSVDKQSHVLATFAVKSFWRPGIEGSTCIGRGGIGWRVEGEGRRSEGLSIEALLKIVLVSIQVDSSRRVSRFELHDREEARRSRGGGGGGDRLTLMA